MLAQVILQALGVWCFVEPCKIAPGGVSGIALLLCGYLMLNRKMLFPQYEGDRLIFCCVWRNFSRGGYSGREEETLMCVEDRKIADVQKHASPL